MTQYQLNLNLVIRLIKSLFVDMLGTTLFTIKIENVSYVAGNSSYDINIIIKLSQSGDEMKYTLTYDPSSNTISNIASNH